MRRPPTILAALLAVLLASGMASAQTKPMIYIPQANLKQVQQPRQPIINIIPPSMALNRALAVTPQAKALGVKLKGALYIVKLKKGNQVVQVRVDAATGAVSP